MKYEPIFGDQSIFNGAPEDAEAVFKSHMRDSRCAYYRLSHGHERYISAEWVRGPEVDSQTFNAMRRIIAEPKHWTVEDKKAGRLPEVGAIVVSDGFNEKCEFLGVGMVNGFFVVRLPNGLISINSASSFSPIETPEEKAARLREEWCIKALRYNSQSGSKVEAIYDALLSGELTMPNKDGE